jgi:hypothetical protein
MPRSKAATAAAPSRANGRARVDQLGGVISAEAYPTGLKTQRRDRAQERRYRGIPSANSSGAMSVSDGAETVDTIVERDSSHFAFDTTGTRIGEFNSRTAAIRALPTRGRS